MRNLLILLGSASTLAACSGGSMGAEAVGSTAPAGGSTSTPTPTPTDIYSQFSNPVDAKTYTGIGGTQSFSYTTDDRVTVGQQAQVYAGNATTVRNSGISIAYDPRSAIFTLTVTDPNSNVSTATNFQDPGSRTDFANSKQPQWGTPNLASLPAGAAVNTNVNYLQAGDGNPLAPYGFSGSGFVNPGTNTVAPDGDHSGSSYVATSFFYEKPGSTTKYVSFAGFVRNSVTFGTATLTAPDGTQATINQDVWHLERGAFAYGAQTAQSAVPISGTGSYSGSMLATMVYNPTLDNSSPLPTYFQWLTGTSTVTVDFATKAVGLNVSGYVLDPQIDHYTTPTTSTLPAGATFAGAGTATIDLVGTGGFSGAMSSFSFKNGGTTLPVTIAGSSIDGAFFGPKAEEVGGGFRVVGGTPDQRIDILGAFTGKK